MEGADNLYGPINVNIPRRERNLAVDFGAEGGYQDSCRFWFQPYKTGACA